MAEPSTRPARSIAHTLDQTIGLRAAKNLRNAVVDRVFRRRRAMDGRGLAGELASGGIRRAAFTIAFNGPWIIDLLTQAWARHQPDLPLVVIDNSSDAAARSAHKRLCRERDVPYLPLPKNPEWNPCRSHGIALNWTWFNVIRHLDLEFAGFIDHDCLPVAAFDLGLRMEGLDAYGLRLPSTALPGAWNLWPGYCFLRPAAAARHAVDFKHRIEYGLDTGGGNWRDFYRRLDPGRVGAAAPRSAWPDLGPGVPVCECLLLDEAFLHLGGASYVSRFGDPLLRRQIADAVLERPAACRRAAPPAD